MVLYRYNRILPRLLAWLLCVSLLLPAFPAASAEKIIPLFSEAAILMDADTGQILFEKNSRQRMYPASITKVMTGLLALTCLDPKAQLTVSQTAVNAVPSTSSHISLVPGEQFPVEEAMYALGMESANDAANVLAEAVSGDLASFARQMTERAQSLGCTGTHFVNANGLPNGNHYTTAYDMALITAAALQVPGLSTYFSTVEHKFPATNAHPEGRHFSNKNRMLPGGQYAYDGVILTKTGWTSDAQGTFIAVVRREQTTLIAVLMKSPLLENKYQDACALMDYGFHDFTRVTVSGKEAARGLKLGDYRPSEEQSISFLIPTELDASGIVFSTEEIVDSRTDSQTQVTLNARLGDMPLPDTQLFLSRQKHSMFRLFAEEELADELSETAGLPRLTLTLTGMALLLLVTWWRLHRREVRRRHRQRRIDGLARAMRRHMEE